jgi:hypothetical protein
MPRKTKIKNTKPVPRYRWEQDCPGYDAVAFCDHDFKSPEAALRNCQKIFNLQGHPGDKFNVLVGEECEIPVDPEDPRVAQLAINYAEYIVDDIDRESDYFQLAGQTSGTVAEVVGRRNGAREILAEQLREWMRAHVVDAWYRIDRSTADRHVVKVPAKTETYPTVTVALDQCLRGKLPPDVRRLLRQARQKLP